jgi:uncharacterized membrane protein
MTYAGVPYGRTTSGAATTALVFSILGWTCVPGLGWVIGLVMALVAWDSTKSGERGGHGMTVTSLWLSGVPVVLGCLWIAAWVVVAIIGAIGVGTA